MLYNYANENSLPVIKISSILKDDSDFTLDIEPSDTGGEKIVNEILTCI